MIDKRKTLLKSDIGSVFDPYGENEFSNIKDGNSVFVMGRVNNPSIVEINEDSTLNTIIEKCGGLINNKKLKLAQFGMPYGSVLTLKNIDDNIKENLDVSLFPEGISKTIIILTEEDCIIQYAKYYIDYIIGNLDNENFEMYKPVSDILLEINRFLDIISKGRANTRDIYDLRDCAVKLKKELNRDTTVIEEIINNFYGEIKEHVEDNICYASQCNQLTKLTITEKCIGCGACKRICPVNCIDGEKKNRHHINYKICTYCGACFTICPVRAITAGDNTLKFLRDLVTPNKIVITQMAPAVRVAIGEEFGLEPGVNVEKKIAGALRKIGVDYVFDTTWGADLTVVEEAAEFQERLEKYFAGDTQAQIPLLTSCCPAWVKFIEQSYPDMLYAPSSAKSPMQMFATVAKEIWAKEKGIERDNLISVALMPCTAKKYEASRAEFSRGLNYDVDYVITTAELINIFKNSDIDLNTIEDGEIDDIMGEYTGAGIIFGRTGGVIEAVTRTTVENMTGKKLEKLEFEELRGYEGFRSCDIDVNGLKLRIGIAHGLKEASVMLDKIRSGEEVFHAIEIMACPCGCVGGGGQPRVKNRNLIAEKRAEGLNEIDRNLVIRKSHENPKVIKIYKDYLDKPLSRKSHELLHTKYFARENKIMER